MINFNILLHSGEEQESGYFGHKRKPAHLQLSSGYGARAKASLDANHNKAIEIPNKWYNLIADLPVQPPPPLHPKTFEPVKPEDLSPLFPEELIRQEASNERFINIPDGVIDVYKIWRPTPLIRFVLLHVVLLLLVFLFYYAINVKEFYITL